MPETDATLVNQTTVQHKIKSNLKHKQTSQTGMQQKTVYWPYTQADVVADKMKLCSLPHSTYEVALCSLF